jgi:hypothetical protein
MRSPFDPLPSRWDNLDIVLRRRGHAILKVGEIHKTLYHSLGTNQTLLNLGMFEFAELFGNDPLARYSEVFGQNQFRKLVRSLIAKKESGLQMDAVRSIVGRKTDEFAVFLEHLQLVRRSGDQLIWKSQISDLGASLEHYVSALCFREFRASATEWNVILRDIPANGGDYDVIACLDPCLIYIECKSGAPNNIEDSQIREFLVRNEALTPELSIFLVDTDDSLDPISQRFNALLTKFDANVSGFDELSANANVFHGIAQTYLINNKPSIESQIARCLRHFHASIKTAGGYSFLPDTFLQSQPVFPEDESPLA